MDGYIGTIMASAIPWAPRNWALCQGQLLNISQYTSLFSLIGTNYGGDGVRTFGLPDLRGRVPVGAGYGPGLSPRILGQRLGSEINHLVIDQLPAHTHNTVVTDSSASIIGTATAKMKVNTTDGEERNPDGQYIGVSSSSDIYQGDATADKSLADDAISVDTSGLSVNVSGLQVEIDATGSNYPVNNMQPSEVINWFICLEGLYPSRP